MFLWEGETQGAKALGISTLRGINCTILVTKLGCLDEITKPEKMVETKKPKEKAYLRGDLGSNLEI